MAVGFHFRSSTRTWTKLFSSLPQALANFLPFRPNCETDQTFYRLLYRLRSLLPENGTNRPRQHHLSRLLNLFDSPWSRRRTSADGPCARRFFRIGDNGTRPISVIPLPLSASRRILGPEVPRNLTLGKIHAKFGQTHAFQGLANIML